MRIVHMADIHLGFSAYSKFDSSANLNVREKDFYQAFIRACTQARDLNPDLVVIAGDLFHTRKPPATAITYAQSALGLFNCPVLVIPGNHDNSMYRMKSPLIALQIVPNVLLIEQTKVVTIEGMTFECIPFTETPPKFHGADYLVAHLRDKRVPQFMSSSIAIPEGNYRLGLLGDYHTPFTIEDRLFYAGALERISFNQLASPCGFNFFEDGTPNSHRYIEIDTRPMIELSQPPEDFEMVRDAIVRCVIPSSASLDWVEQIKEIAFFVTVKVLDQDSQQSLLVGAKEFSVGPLLDTFDEYCKANEVKYAPETVNLARKTLVEVMNQKEAL